VPAVTMSLRPNLCVRLPAPKEAQGLTQTAAARIFGATLPDVSKMLRGDFRQFSVERLMRFLALRGRDVKIIVVPTKREPQITVTALAR